MCYNINKKKVNCNFFDDIDNGRYRIYKKSGNWIDFNGIDR